MTPFLLRLLLKSFDSALSDKEQMILNRTMAESEEARLERARYERLRGCIAATGEFAFTPFFVERVLRSLASAQDDLIEWMASAFRTVILIAAVAVFMIMGFNLLKDQSFSVASALALPQQTALPQSLDLEVTPQ